MQKQKLATIPKEVFRLIWLLEKSGFNAYLVGGCVRDLLRNEAPNDWDIATIANPEQIQAVFVKQGIKTVYENAFGTVAVLTESEDTTLKIIEITPFRIESAYTDKRHPDKITWAKTIEEDLSRRDFACNAMAAQIQSSPKEVAPGATPTEQATTNYSLIDPFNGQADIEDKIIRAVGDSDKRFQEDGLRTVRAVRFAVSLEKGKVWQIEENTAKAIEANNSILKQIAKERIKDELIKIIKSAQGAIGIEMLRRLGLLQHIIPELEQGLGVAQNKHHIFQVYPHNLLALDYACKNDFSLETRLAALLHDIAKPKTKRGQGNSATFYNHEFLSGKMAEKILERLRFPRKQLEKIVNLIKSHLFYYNVGEVSEASVRRLLRKVGQDNIEDLLKLRHSDRIGSGVPKAEPYKLRHLKYLLEKVSKDPISAKMLKVNGADIMNVLSLKPGPQIGQVLSYLLSYVLSYPQGNKKPLLLKKIKELGKLSEKDLNVLSQKAKQETDAIIKKQDKMTKEKYWVS